MDLQMIQQAIRSNRYSYGPHATKEALADRLSILEVWDGVTSASAEIIEEYPDDPRGPSCLIYCQVNGIPEHVVIAHPCKATAIQMGFPDLAFMITCYRPGGPKYANKWQMDFKHRNP